MLRLFFWSILENIQYWIYTWHYWNYTWNYWNYNWNSQKILFCFEHLVFLTCFVFFQICQKVCPHIPGGCIHKESDKNRVLSIVYLSFGDIFFLYFWLCFWIVFLFNMTPMLTRPQDIHTGNQFYVLKQNFLS